VGGRDGEGDDPVRAIFSLARHEDPESEMGLLLFGSTRTSHVKAE